MVTRFRLTNDGTAPAVSPTLQSYTHSAPTTVRRRLLTSDSSSLTTTAYTPDAGDHLSAGDSLWCQFVSEGMKAGVTFTSGDTIKFAVQGLEAHANNNLNVQLFVSIVDSAGTSVQRTLRSKVEDNTELGTSLGNRFLSTTQSGANYTTVSGDRLVVEFSVEGTPSATGGTQGHNSSMRFGGSGGSGDLPENDTETGTGFNPWIEFVPTDIFPNPQTATPTTASMTLTASAPTIAHVITGASPTALTLTTFAPVIGLTVTPTTASLSTATFAPTVTATQNQLLTPSTASVTTATFAPTVTASDHQSVTPTTAAVVTETFEPTVAVSDNQAVTPDAASLALSTFAPTVSFTDQAVAEPETASLSLSAFAPTVTATAHQVVTPDVASIATALFAPTVTATDHKVLTPDAATLATALFAPTVTATDHKAVTPGPLALSLSAFSPTVSVGEPIVTIQEDAFWLARYGRSR